MDTKERAMNRLSATFSNFGLTAQQRHTAVRSHYCKKPTWMARAAKSALTPIACFTQTLKGGDRAAFR